MFGSKELAEFIISVKIKNKNVSVSFYADTCCAHPCKEGLYLAFI